MTIQEQNYIVRFLVGVAKEHADGNLGERELISITMAANAVLRDDPINPIAGVAFKQFSVLADKRLMDRVSELDADSQ